MAKLTKQQRNELIERARGAPQCFRLRTSLFPPPAAIHAIKNVAKGIAGESDQKLAMAYIIKEIGRAYDNNFVPGSADETNFLQGRAFVGTKITRIIEQDHQTINPLLDEVHNDE